MTDTPKRPQVGGKHYAALAIHPDHFADVNRWDPCAFSIVKYITRHGSKNGAQDVQKAIDFVQRRGLLLVERAKFDLPITKKGVPVITANEYCRRNGIEGADRMAMMHLEEWVHRNDEKQGAMVISFLRDTLRTYEAPEKVRYWIKEGPGLQSCYRQPSGQPEPDDGYTEVEKDVFILFQHNMFHGDPQ